jgi:hypothetical protein
MVALGLTSAVLMIFSMVILALWVREGVESQNLDDGYGPKHDDGFGPIHR